MRPGGPYDAQEQIVGGDQVGHGSRGSVAVRAQFGRPCARWGSAPGRTSRTVT